MKSNFLHGQTTKDEKHKTLNSYTKAYVQQKQKATNVGLKN